MIYIIIDLLNRTRDFKPFDAWQSSQTHWAGTDTEHGLRFTRWLRNDWGSGQPPIPVDAESLLVRYCSVPRIAVFSLLEFSRRLSSHSSVTSRSPSRSKTAERSKGNSPPNPSSTEQIALLKPKTSLACPGQAALSLGISWYFLVLGNFRQSSPL